VLPSWAKLAGLRLLASAAAAITWLSVLIGKHWREEFAFIGYLSDIIYFELLGRLSLSGLDTNNYSEIAAGMQLRLGYTFLAVALSNKAQFVNNDGVYLIWRIYRWSLIAEVA
jgi:hypothetical protein